MKFSDIQGNEHVVQALTTMIGSGRIPHAIMFQDVDGGPGVAMCLAFLDALMGSSSKLDKLIHPDVHFVYPVSGAGALSFIQQWRELVLSNPYFTESELDEALGLEGKSSLIAVADAKLILEKLAFNSLEGGYKAVVVYLPERMNQEAANRLLKSIEEPPQMTQFLLVTHSPEKVLPTILSRCQNIRLLPSGKTHAAGGEAVEAYRSLFRELTDALLERDLMHALEVGESLAALGSREKQKAYCRFAAEQMRKIFMLQQGMEQVADMGPADDFLRDYASRMKKTFPRAAAAMLDRALLLIERNVNQKILFCDMVNRMYLYIV